MKQYVNKQKLQI